MIIRQSTARTILVGPVLDSTGAAKTDEVVGSIKITKNGTVGAADGSATLTHDHAGKYRFALTASDCDTVGVLEISLNSGTNDMPVKACNVIEQPIWDALFADGATGLLPANVTHFGGTAGTFSSGLPAAILADAPHGGTSATLSLGGVTLTASGSTPNLTLAGSGSGNGIEWTRSGSGDPLDADIVGQLQDGIPKVGETHRYTQVDSSATTTDVSIGVVP